MYCTMVQSLVELQRLLWLNSPILHHQALFQLLQKNFMPAPMGAATAICCLCSLLFFHCSSPFSLLLWTPTFTVILQLLCSANSCSLLGQCHLPSCLANRCLCSIGEAFQHVWSQWLACRTVYFWGFSLPASI